MRISDWSSDVCSSDLLGTDSESAAKARSHNHADGDEGNEAGNDEIYAGWNNDSISGDAQAIADGHAESDSVNKAEGTNSEAGNDLILRSEEHTSELQSLMRISYAVFCLTKKNKATKTQKK